MPIPRSAVLAALALALILSPSATAPAFAKNAFSAKGSHAAYRFRPVLRHDFRGFDAGRLKPRPRFARANIAIVIGAPASAGVPGPRLDESLCLPGQYCTMRLGYGPGAPKIISLNRTGKAIRCQGNDCAPVE